MKGGQSGRLRDECDSGRFQAQDESEARGLRGGGQQELLEGVEVCHQVHQGVGQDEDIKRKRETWSAVSIFSLLQ